MSLELDEHRRLVADRPRIDALARAIAAVVRPGDVVIDLASGTGILGLMACRAGASRVYCIENGNVLGLAREIARANGCDDRMRFVHAHSSWAELPERADLVVSDQIGRFGFDAGLIGAVADIRARLLKPEGRMVPASVALHVGLVESAALRAELSAWNDRPGGFDFTPAREIAINSGHPLGLDASNLLGRGAAASTIDLQTAVDAPHAFSVTLSASRDGVLDGVGGWFVAELADGVTMTNAPGCAGRIARRNVVFPISRPVALHAGDEVGVTMRIRPSDLLVRWTVTVRDERFDQSTFRGMLLGRDLFDRTNPAFVPRLTARGLARRTVLELCDGRPLGEIERQVYARHRGLFDGESAAQTFVAEVVTRYSA